MSRLSSLGLLACITWLTACSGPAEPGFRPRRESVEEVEGVEARTEEVEPPAEAGARPRPSEPAAPAVALPEGIDPRLADPANFTERAPDTYAVELATSEGPIIIDVTRAWAPNGADRFYNMVRSGLLTDVAFFRVVDDFMAQAGMPGIPALAGVWNTASIPDDPRTQSNTVGMVSFAATSMPNSRSTQFFISTADNTNLDPMGFAPFGRVRDMTTVGRLYSGYGDGPPRGRGPSQARIVREGNAYLRAEFGDLDYIERARILP
jgi:peptidyl-prolyl cis-trans isomerase A (cyclophilin A)